jgi:hypothetical protein
MERRQKVGAAEAAELKRGPKGSPLYRGHEKIAVFFRSEQAAALRAEALRRAAAAGVTRADVSEIVREAVDAWLAKSGKR